MNFFLFLYFLPVITGFTEIQKLITKSLINHFEIKHCILASSSENKLNNFYDFKVLSGWNIVSTAKSPAELDYYINGYLYPFISPATLGTKDKTWELTKKLLMPKTLIVFQNSKVEYIVKLFYPYKNGQTAGYFTWVAFLEEFDAKSFSLIRVPYNTEFIIVVKANSTVHKLSEIYLVRETPFLISYGTWDEKNGLRVNRPDLSFYQRRLNMNQTTLYSYKFRESTDKILNSYHLEILGDFAKMMNTTIVRVEAAPYGGVTISDLAYLMSDGTYVKDNVGPILTIKSFIYIKEPEFTKSKLYFILPFSSSFLYSLLLFLIQATVVNILLHYIFKSKYSEDTINWVDSVFKIFETFCNQCGCNQSKLYTSRVIAYTVHLFTLIVISAFSAVLYSHLTINVSHPPFQNLQELVEGKLYSLGTITNGYENFFFMVSKDPFYKNIYQNILRKNFVENLKSGLDRACKEKHAQIAYEFDVRMTSVDCNLFQIQEPVITRLTSIRFFVHSNGIKEAFTYKLHWFYSSGIIHKMGEDLKDFHKLKPSTKYLPLELNQTLYVLAIIIVGILAAFVFLIIELILNLNNERLHIVKM